MKKSPYIQFGIADYSPLDSEFQTLFNSVANIVAQMYSSFLREVEIPKCQKISITISNYSNETNYISGKDFVCGVIDIRKIYYDFAKFDTFSFYQKKVEILELIHGFLIELCDQNGYNTNSFVSAYNKIKENDYRSVIILKGKKFTNRKTKNSVVVKVEQKETGALIIFDFYDSNSQQLKSVETIEIPNSPIFLNSYMSSGGKWLDDNCFVLLDRDKMHTLKVFLSGKFENIKFKMFN
jgi:hypothetical protein